MNFPLVANVIVFAVLLFALGQTRHKQWSLAKKVLLGLVIGVVFGLALQLIYGSDSQVLKDSIQWFNIVGNGYVQLLQMIVMPLVFASILSAVARLHNASQLGKISFLSIGTLLFTTLIAALVGVLVTNLFGLTAEGLVQGSAETARLNAIQSDPLFCTEEPVCRPDRCEPDLDHQHRYLLRLPRRRGAEAAER